MATGAGNANANAAFVDDVDNGGLSQPSGKWVPVRRWDSFGTTPYNVQPERA